MIDPINIGTILVTIIGVGGAWLTQRTSAKASRMNSKEVAEVEAYNRARSMDLKTIERQDEEIAELNASLLAMRRRLVEKEQENEKQKIIIRALRRGTTETE